MREFSPKLDYRYDLEAEREAKRRERLRVIPGSIAIVAALFYYGDVLDNYQEAQSSTPTIDVFHVPEGEPATSATLFFAGLGDNDGWRLASSQGPITDHVLDGEWWSVGYNNAFLSEETMAQDAIELAEERGITTVSVYGYSAGGPISLKTTVSILENSDLLLQSAWLDSAPAGDEGIRPEQRQTRDTLMSVLDWVPSARYSTPIRYLAEMAFRSSQFTDFEQFLKVSDFVMKGLEEGRIPGTWLIVDQASAAMDDDVDESLAKIAELREDSLKPTTIALGTAQPGIDPIINNDVAPRNTCIDSNAVGIPCFIYGIPGAVHNLPEVANEQYHEIISGAAPKLKAIIARSLLEYNQSFYEPVEINYSTEPLKPKRPY